jgi:hypothetical protein
LDSLDSETIDLYFAGKHNAESLAYRDAIAANVAFLNIHRHRFNIRMLPGSEGIALN